MLKENSEAISSLQVQKKKIMMKFNSLLINEVNNS